MHLKFQLPRARGCGQGRTPTGLLLALAAALLFGLRTPAAAPRPDAASEFFQPETVQSVHLEIAPEDLDRLNRALPHRIYVPGTFRWKDQKFQSVGIRYKGDSSSIPNAGHKRSFLINFSEYKKSQRFLGLRHVALDNGIQFGSLFSERLITDILRQEGVPASRCNYARVDLNGKPMGVYVNVERIDRSFLKRHFASANGLLFKVDQGGPGADLHEAEVAPAEYRKVFELHAGEEKGAYAALVDFMRSINAPGSTEAQLRQVLDVDAFINTTSVLLLSGAFDQYTGWGPHNYYLYQEPSTHRWHYVPWDLDVGFADHAFGRIAVLEGWNAAWPAPVPGRALMERLVNSTNLLAQYRSEARRLLDTSFKPDLLIPKLRHLYAQIQPALAEDPYPPRRVTVPSDTSFEDILRSMEQFIRDRYQLARAQLDAPGERPAFKPMLPEPPPQEPHPGPPSPDAPSDLRVSKISSAGVELEWVDHAQGEVAFIVQGCEGAGCTNLVNRVGQPGENATRATDNHVQAGVTYRYAVYALIPTPQGPRGTGLSNLITVKVPDDRGAQP